MDYAKTGAAKGWCFCSSDIANVETLGRLMVWGLERSSSEPLSIKAVSSRGNKHKWCIPVVRARGDYLSAKTPNIGQVAKGANVKDSEAIPRSTR